MRKLEELFARCNKIAHVIIRCDPVAKLLVGYEFMKFRMPLKFSFAGELYR